MILRSILLGERYVKISRRFFNMGDEHMAGGFTFRMKPLPKAEYRLSKLLIDKYELKDQSELMTIALRLMHEIDAMHDCTGEQWIIRTVNTLRSVVEEERVYTLNDSVGA